MSHLSLTVSNKPIFKHDPRHLSSLRDLTMISLHRYHDEVSAKMFAAIEAGRAFEADMNTRNLIEVLREIERRAICANIETAKRLLQLRAERTESMMRAAA